MRGPRSTSPCPTKQQVEKLKLLQTAIKKRTTKPDFMTNYKIHIIISIVIGFQLFLIYLLPSKQKNTLSLMNLKLSHTIRPNAFSMFQLLQLQQNITLMQAKTLFKNDFTQQINVEKCKLSFIEEIPVYYNFKEFYPQCNHQVYNQGNCSSSYSIAVSSSFSDRVCKQNQTQQLSAQNLLSCDGKLNLGCKGGHLTRSADYIIKHGLTTNECHPFRGDDTFKECTNALDHCQRFKAESYCQLQNKDGYFNERTSGCDYASLQRFLIYKDGIYQVLDGQPHFHGGQAVKIIGWGEHNGQQYWIIENTWGDTWGINGLAKISIDSFSEMSQQALSLNI